MENNPTTRFAQPPAISPSTQMSILENLLVIVSASIVPELDVFSTRLSNILLQRSTQTVLASEADLCLNAFHLLTGNRAAFCNMAAERVHKLLRNEALGLAHGGLAKPHGESDWSLVTFDEMENKLMLANACQGIDLQNAAVLAKLNLRLARLCARDELTVAQSPFRPALFLQGVYESWCAFDAAADSRAQVLRLLQPEVFLQLQPILRELNDALNANGIVPASKDGQRNKKATQIPLPADSRERRDASLYYKLQRWLTATAKIEFGAGRSEGARATSQSGRGPSAGGGMAIAPELFDYLNENQKRNGAPETRIDAGQASILRQIKDRAPQGSLTAVDANTIELLAKVFDYIFVEQNIPANFKKLIGQLQVPLLKAALIDRDFFLKEQHPARRLVEKLARSSLTWDHQKGPEDPVYKMAEQLVDRVQQEFEQQIELFSDVVSELETFIDEQERSSVHGLAEPIAEAMRQEKMQLAREAAENDIASRIETGEVAGFVETFLEAQWTRILTLAHSVVDSRPRALIQARQAMDDLIWSVKPKNSPEERKELVTRLPALLSMLNAWLNAIKWDEPERVVFFSTLVERHAAIVRVQSEMTPRRQVEMAVNAAQKASERRFFMHARKLEQRLQDKFVSLVDSLECGQWLEFLQGDQVRAKYRLTWISPQRSRYIFTSRVGQGSFSFNADELAQSLRERQATIVPATSVINRALAVVLEEVEA
jgi:hypothetical protein